MRGGHEPRPSGAGLPAWFPPGLTPAQLEAVMAEDRVIVVLAAAGSGKTGVLTLRAARRVADGDALATRTLVCTFSRKAAEELRNRLVRLGVRGVAAGTIHRLALRMLSDWRDQDALPAVKILGDRRRLLGPAASTHGLDRDTVAFLDSEIGWAKARLFGPDRYELEARRAGRVPRVPAATVAEHFAAYEAERRRRSLLDLDDLLLEAATLMEEHEGFAAGQRWRYRHVYVDETQDVNPAQFRLVRSIVGTDPDLFAVGDPRQSVYGWNGADPDLLDDLGRLCPGARVVSLDDNHRCTPAIVSVAGAALGFHEEIRSTRPEGPVPVVVAHPSDDEEARWVARQAWLARPPHGRWSEIAVLARTNAQLAPVADALRALGIPSVRAGAELGPASDLADDKKDDASGHEAEPHEEGVVLSTFHRAKGLQWPCVFVIGLREGLVPLRSARSDAQLSEERRLLYVALTRAEDRLSCSWSAAADRRARPGTPSRWLTPVQEVCAALELARAPVSGAVASAQVARLRALLSRDLAG